MRWSEENEIVRVGWNGWERQNASQEENGSFFKHKELDNGATQRWLLWPSTSISFKVHLELQAKMKIATPSMPFWMWLLPGPGHWVIAAIEPHLPLLMPLLGMKYLFFPHTMVCFPFMKMFKCSLSSWHSSHYALFFLSPSDPSFLSTLEALF